MKKICDLMEKVLYIVGMASVAVFFVCTTVQLCSRVFGFQAAFTEEVANAALLRLEVDEMGLDATDRRMLRSIIEFYHGGPVGLETLAATIGEEAVTLEDVYEPYLLQQGFLTRTPRGRCVTRRAYEHLGLEYIGQQEIDL